MENVATTHSFALFARFLHFHENNDLKVPERSKNGPKKVPILSQRPKFCLCSDFSRQVPNPKSYIGAPENIILSRSSLPQYFLCKTDFIKTILFLRRLEMRNITMWDSVRGRRRCAILFHLRSNFICIIAFWLVFTRITCSKLSKRWPPCSNIEARAHFMCTGWRWGW